MTTFSKKNSLFCEKYPADLTLYLLTWRIWWAPYNVSKGQMGFNSVFKGLKMPTEIYNQEAENYLRTYNFRAFSH